MVSAALGKQASADNKRQLEDRPQTSLLYHPHWGTMHSSLLDRLQEGLIATDLNFNIVGGNEAVLRMYEYTAEQLLGRSISFLCPGQEQLLSGAAVAGLQQKGYYKAQIRTETQSGQAIYVHLSLTSLVDADSNPIGIVAVLVDITERKLLEIALNQCAEKSPKAAEAVGQAQTPGSPATREINGAKFVISSPLMHKFMSMVDRVAANPEIVLITGETGSGKPTTRLVTPKHGSTLTAPHYPSTW